MEFDKQRKLDVEYDNKAMGDLIDPYQWNLNFKKIEEVFNQNIDTTEKNLSSISDSAIPSFPIEGLGQTEESNVREQLISIVAKLLLKSDMSEVEELLKQCVQISRLTTTSTTLPPGEKVKVSSAFDKNGYLNLDFAIPQGENGIFSSIENGMFALKVNENGHLIVTYNSDEENAPNIYIDENGHLIYEFE